MTTNRRFSSALQALTQLEAESSKPDPRATAAGTPGLREVLAGMAPLPAEALLLGIAADGLPVLLNLHDPHPGPMLIAGDGGSGKTSFLRTIAHSAALTQDSKDVQFAVITNYPDEWEDVKTLAHQAGVFSVGERSTQEFLNSLAGWAHSNKDTHRCVLLLVDDLESVASLDLESLQSFRWLLLRGPARHVWPIVTLNAPRYGQVIAWLESFRTRIFGRVANHQVAAALGADQAAALDQLEARIQFSLREREKWLRFWLPSSAY